MMRTLSVSAPAPGVLPPLFYSGGDAVVGTWTGMGVATECGGERGETEREREMDGNGNWREGHMGRDFWNMT
jgi:hypothetical protein